MNNGTARRSENQVRRLVDLETGEEFRVVQEQIEKDGSETLVVSGSELPNLVTRVTKNGYIRNSKRYILFFSEGIDMLSKMLDNNGKMLMAMCRVMGYGNKLHATTNGLAELAGIRKQHASRAIKNLLEMGAIHRCAPNPEMPNVPAYRVDGRFLFRGAEGDRNKAVERQSKARSSLTVIKDRAA